MDVIEWDQIAERRTRGNRWQLINVAQKYELRLGCYGSEQAFHHREVEHRSFVNDHDARRDRIVAMVKKYPAIRGIAEQAMNCYGIDGRGQKLLIFCGWTCNPHQRRGHRLPHAERRATGGRGERDLASRHLKSREYPKDCDHDRGFSGTGSA